MKFVIGISKQGKENPHEIPIGNWKVPFGDIPYFLQCEKEGDNFKVTFEYPGTEKDKEVENISPKSKVIYGKITGRIYEVSASRRELENLIYLLQNEFLRKVGQVSLRFAGNISVGTDLINTCIQKADSEEPKELRA